MEVKHLTCNNQVDFLCAHGICIDLTFVDAGVSDADISEVQVPVFHERSLHADAHVVQQTPVLQTDHCLQGAYPHHLVDRQTHTLLRVDKYIGSYPCQLVEDRHARYLQ